MRINQNLVFNTYLENDLIWINNSLNWEEVFFSYLDNFNIYSFLSSSFFVNSFFFIDSQVKLSFLDIIFLLENSKINYNRELYDLFFWDFLVFFDNVFLPFNFLFYTNFQDFLSLVSFYSPELTLVIMDYINLYWLENSFQSSINVVYDVFSDRLFIIASQLVSYFILFFVYIWLIVLFFSVFRVFNIFKYNNFYQNLFIFNFFSISKENRLQLESTLFIGFIFFFYWTMMVLTFDSDKEELIESFNSLLFILFVFMILFLLLKYSTHYFSFLEASVEEGRSVSFISKQFFRDFMNTFSLFLRFFVLLFRLNVYDTLDDFYDSYYIFLCDFDDDEYVNELFFSGYSFWFFSIDNNDDANFTMEDESDHILDIFYSYFVNWSKLFLFIFFIVEEFLRLILAFFISYLIIFDIHAVNSSYSEDSYFVNKRNSFSKTTVNNYRI